MSTVMLRHAFLIMTHEYTLVLEYLVQLLDHQNHGIYIHIDQKASALEKKKIKDLQYRVKKSRIYFLSRYKVFWGTNSIVKAQLAMLNQSVKEAYDYYHFLSGADLPIKCGKTIQAFFEENNGKEFIHFGTQQYQRDIQQRFNVYHYFTRQLGRKRDKKCWVYAETYALAVQRRLHIDRTKKHDYTFYGGSNWCSITNAFACYVVKNFPTFRKGFYFSQISDESVWQTIVMASPYRQNLYHDRFDNDCGACLRYIDWERGNPYVFRREDFEDLMASNCMFARKFDEKTDLEIIEQLYHTLKE